MSKRGESWTSPLVRMRRTKRALSDKSLEGMKAKGYLKFNTLNAVDKAMVLDVEPLAQFNITLGTWKGKDEEKADLAIKDSSEELKKQEDAHKTELASLDTKSKERDSLKATKKKSSEDRKRLKEVEKEIKELQGKTKDYDAAKKDVLKKQKKYATKRLHQQIYERYHNGKKEELKWHWGAEVIFDHPAPIDESEHTTYRDLWRASCSLLAMTMAFRYLEAKDWGGKTLYDKLTEDIEKSPDNRPPRKAKTAGVVTIHWYDTAKIREAFLAFSTLQANERKKKKKSKEYVEAEKTYNEAIAEGTEAYHPKFKERFKKYKTKTIDPYILKNQVAPEVDGEAKRSRKERAADAKKKARAEAAQKYFDRESSRLESIEKGDKPQESLRPPKDLKKAPAYGYIPHGTTKSRKAPRIGDGERFNNDEINPSGLKAHAVKSRDLHLTSAQAVARMKEEEAWGVEHDWTVPDHYYPARLLWWIRKVAGTTTTEWQKNGQALQNGDFGMVTMPRFAQTQEEIDEKKGTTKPLSSFNITLEMAPPVPGLKGEKEEKIHEHVRQSLDEGYPVIINYPGHFSVINGYVNFKDGSRKYVVCDSGTSQLQYLLDEYPANKKSRWYTKRYFIFKVPNVKIKRLTTKCTKVIEPTEAKSK